MVKSGNNSLRRKKRKEKRKGKKATFNMVSQKLTSHEDQQPGYFSWPMLTE